MIKSEMINCHMTLIKLQQISGKIDKYECFTGKKILPTTQHRLIGEAKFSYPPLGRAYVNK